MGQLPRHEGGNAFQIGSSCRGWFVGPYQAADHPMFASRQVELKWGTHRAGERRADWDRGLAAWSLAILIDGDLSIEFEDKSYRLNVAGDLVLWRPLVPHSWSAHSDSIVLTVRWSDSAS